MWYSVLSSKALFSLVKLVYLVAQFLIDDIGTGSVDAGLRGKVSGRPPHGPDQPPALPVVGQDPLDLTVEEAVGQADHQALGGGDHGLHTVGDLLDQGHPDAGHRRLHHQGQDVTKPQQGHHKN